MLVMLSISSYMDCLITLLRLLRLIFPFLRYLRIKSQLMVMKGRRKADLLMNQLIYSKPTQTEQRQAKSTIDQLIRAHKLSQAGQIIK